MIQQQRQENPAAKSRLRKVFPEDEHKLDLQKFAAAIFQGDLQLLCGRS